MSFLETTPSTCLTDEALAALAEGVLSGDAYARARAHIDGCDACRALLTELVRAFPPAAPSAHEALEREALPFLPNGSTIGRYVVLHPVGAGGMGVVYLGYDPELDRKVALKLVRSEIAESERAQARLAREAQSQARLAHPNVVAIYDVGRWAGGIFLAMEYVEGRSLGDWLADGRTRRELLDVFFAAGRGLDAAHRAGLVHGDFKPANVLVGSDGRVRITDFGLARATERDDEAGEAVGTSGTQRGGTPFYMAPEQRRHGAIDARADQFSFSVALLAALNAHAPGAPTWMARILSRGMAQAPAARYASMSELLTALDRDPRRTRRRILSVVAALALLVASLGAFGVRHAARRRACRELGAAIDATWNAPRRAAVEHAFVGTGKRYAADAFRHVAAALDDYVAGWRTMAVDACEATRLRGVRSEASLSLVRECLDEKRDHVEATVEVLQAADGATVMRGSEMVADLPQLASCADVEALRAQAPASESQATQARTLRRRIEQANAWTHGGQLVRARADAEALLKETRAFGNQRLIASALVLMGVVEQQQQFGEQAITTFSEAAWAALAAGDDPAAGDACIHVASLLTFSKGSSAAEPWLSCARALNTRLGAHAGFEVQLAELEAQIAERDGHAKEGSEVLRRLIEAIERQEGAMSSSLVWPLRELAMVLLKRGQIAEARTAARRSLAIAEQALGADHPKTARVRLVLGHALADSDLPEAAAQLARAHEVIAADEGSDSMNLIEVEQALGNVRMQQHRFDEALALSLHVVAIERRALGPTHPALAAGLSNLAALYMDHDDCISALSYARQALTIQAVGPGQRLGLALTLMGMGSCELSLGRSADAIAHESRAESILSSAGDDPVTLWEARLVHAKASWLRGDHAGANRLVLGMDEALGTLGEDGAEMRKHLRDWLKTRE